MRALLLCLLVLTGCATQLPRPESVVYAKSCEDARQQHRSLATQPGYWDDDMVAMCDGQHYYERGDITESTGGNGNVQVVAVIRHATISKPLAQQRLNAVFVDPAFDQGEQRACLSEVGGYLANLLVTQYKLGQGCREANPVAAGPIIVRILPMAAAGTLCYLEAKQSPFIRPTKMRKHYLFGAFRLGVAVKDSMVSCN